MEGTEILDRIKNETKDFSKEFRDVHGMRLNGTLPLESDAFKTMEQLANKYGFKCESHQVVTDDGYILNVFRIKSANLPAGAPVAFCQHGLTSAANAWIVNDPSVAPAF